LAGDKRIPIPFEVTSGIRAEVRLAEIADILQKLEDLFTEQLELAPDHVVYFLAREYRAGYILRSVAERIWLKRSAEQKTGLVKIRNRRGVGVKIEMASETDSVKIPNPKGASVG
jgi:hypothetical protein